MSDARRAEIRRGLAETRRYLLSHHGPGEHDRCHALELPWRDRPVRLCARCSGVYPGILAGVLAAAAGLVPVRVVLVAVLPAAALVDWAITAYTARTGTNLVRTATGSLLGAGYGIGLVGLTRPGTRLPVVAVGLGYALLAAALLAYSRE